MEEVKIDNKDIKPKPVATEVKIDTKKIKTFIKKLSETVAKGNDAEIKSVINEVVADPSVNRPDCKYFIYLHGIYSSDIYEMFEKRVEYLQYVRQVF